jgi:hypothetical protein
VDEDFHTGANESDGGIGGVLGIRVLRGVWGIHHCNLYPFSGLVMTAASISSVAAVMPIAVIGGIVVFELRKFRRLGSLGKFFHSLPKYRFFACFCQFLMA